MDVVAAASPDGQSGHCQRRRRKQSDARSHGLRKDRQEAGRRYCCWSRMVGACWKLSTAADKILGAGSGWFYCSLDGSKMVTRCRLEATHGDAAGAMGNAGHKFVQQGCWHEGAAGGLLPPPDENYGDKNTLRGRWRRGTSHRSEPARSWSQPIGAIPGKGCRRTPLAGRTGLTIRAAIWRLAGGLAFWPSHPSTGRTTGAAWAMQADGHGRTGPCGGAGKSGR